MSGIDADAEGTMIRICTRVASPFRSVFVASATVLILVLALARASGGQEQAAPAARVFASDAGFVLNFIKPDRTAEFESVMARLKDALQKSDKPERKQQAATWKVFRAVEPAAGGNVLYVFMIDPAVKNADYTVSTILAEAFPEEVQTLYKQYAESYATGQNFVSMKLVTALGQ